MRKKNKKLLSHVLVLVACLGILPTNTLAVEDEFTIKEGKDFSQWEQSYYGYTSQDRVLVKYNGVSDNVVVPEGITIIGKEAFLGCSQLTRVMLPDSLIKIENYAFKKCIRLTGLILPNQVSTIGAFAFEDCQSLADICFPDNLSEIGMWAFKNCYSLQNISLPNNVTKLANGIFSDCSLIDVKIPTGVTEIGDYAFASCSLTNISIPESVVRIGNGVFHGNNCTDLIIPGNVQSIGESAFSSNSNLATVTIRDGVADIGSSAFQACFNLNRVIIPASVTFIGKDAFTYCSDNLTIYGIVNSYAETYAHQNSIPFSVIEQSSQPETPPASSYTATPTNDALTVDGKVQVPTAYKIGGANYFQLRDVAMMLNGTSAQFSVDYDAERQAVIIVTGQPYKPLGTELAGTTQISSEAILGNNDIYINGEKMDFAVYKIGGANFFQIRALGQTLGFNVGWTKADGMFIESDKPYDPNN